MVSDSQPASQASSVCATSKVLGYAILAEESRAMAERRSWGRTLRWPFRCIRPSEIRICLALLALLCFAAAWLHLADLPPRIHTQPRTQTGWLDRRSLEQRLGSSNRHSSKKPEQWSARRRCPPSPPSPPPPAADWPAAAASAAAAVAATPAAAARRPRRARRCVITSVQIHPSIHPSQQDQPTLPPPPPTHPPHHQIVVLGGSGYVGSHVLQAALHRGADPVVSVNRAGQPPHLQAAPWASQVSWVRGAWAGGRRRGGGEGG